jgi:hypothetical protein
MMSPAAGRVGEEARYPARGSHGYGVSACGRVVTSDHRRPATTTLAARPPSRAFAAGAERKPGDDEEYRLYSGSMSIPREMSRAQ